jgi:hypothetical protein
MILTPQAKKRTLLLGIALLSIGGFSAVDTLDINFMLKFYGLLAVCQFSFLLFFLSRVSLKDVIKSFKA